MAEAGSFAEKVKQQADIVRVVGEYVRLKKTGKDFSGLCPFHQEKTPSFTVSPIKQIFYCFGCGKGGDIFNFVMEMERCEFPDALRLVAEKCGISIPKPKPSSPAERTQSSVRWRGSSRARIWKTAESTKLRSIDLGLVMRRAVAICCFAISRENMRRSCWQSRVSSRANRTAAACLTASAVASRSRSRTKAGKSSRLVAARWAM